MPFLTHENLRYIARGIRRHLYGRACEGAPESYEQLQAWMRFRSGLTVTLAIFGPLEHYGRCVSGYGMIWSLRSLADGLERGDHSYRPDLGLPVRPIERSLGHYLNEHPGCDLVVVLHRRNPRTNGGWDIDASRDPDYRACRLRERAADRERRRRSDNADGVPLLDLDRQVLHVEIPVRAWGSYKRSTWQPGGIHFYTDDYRFNRLWTDPDQLLRSAPLFACEPNFTMGDQMPRAFAAAAVCRKRWLARYWQSKGLPVLVDLFVPERWAELNLLGVPQGWSAYSTRGGELTVGDLDFEFENALQRSGRGRITFLVIGGSRKVAAWCQSHAAAGAVHVEYGASKFIHSRKGQGQGDG